MYVSILCTFTCTRFHTEHFFKSLTSRVVSGSKSNVIGALFESFLTFFDNWKKSTKNAESYGESGFDRVDFYFSIQFRKE